MVSEAAATRNSKTTGMSNGNGAGTQEILSATTAPPTKVNPVVRLRLPDLSTPLGDTKPIERVAPIERPRGMPDGLPGRKPKGAQNGHTGRPQNAAGLPTEDLHVNGEGTSTMNGSSARGGIAQTNGMATTVSVLPKKRPSGDWDSFRISRPFPPRGPPSVRHFSSSDVRDAASTITDDPYAWVPNKGEEDCYAFCTDRNSSGGADTLATGSFALPLELFDNPEMERMPVEELMGNVEGDLANARSRFFMPGGEFTWAPCHVLDFRPETGVFTIKWVCNGKLKKVKRLNLLFDKESRAAFRRRLRVARRYREMIESSMRYNSYIQQLEFNHLNILDGEFQERIMYMAGWQMSKRHEALIHTYMEEVMMDYQRAVKQAVLNYEIVQPEKMDIFREKKIDLQAMSMPVPARGCAPLPGGEHGIVIITYVGTSDEPRALEVPEIIDRAEIVAEDLCIALPEFLQCVQAYYSEFSIRDVCLVNSKMESLQRPLALSDFSSCQRQHVVDSMAYLRNEWTISVIQMVEELTPVGGFTIDLHPDSAEAQYRDSIIRFVKRLSLVMADELRTCVLESLESYSRLWTDFVADADGAENETSSAPVSSPLFKVQLKISDRKVVYEPSLREFADSSLYVIDDVISSVVGIEDITSKLNTTLETENNEIPTMSATEKAVVECKESIASIIKAQLEGPHQLLSKFEKYADLVECDVDEFMEQWNAGEHSLEEVMAEVEKYSELASAVESEVDNEIRFTMIVVDCSVIKHTLVEKALLIGKKILDHVNDTCVARNVHVSNRYQSICDQLGSDPSTAEDLEALRAFLSDASDELKSLEEEIEQSKRVYDILVANAFHLTDEQSHIFWTTVYWPTKMLELVKDCEVRMEQGKKNFIEEIRDHQKQLTEDIESISNEVDAFIQLGDIEQVEERYAYVLDIETKLKKSVELSELYMKREGVLGLPLTEHPRLDSVAKIFEPNVILWKYCAEYTRNLPEWMDGPFTHLDPDQISTDVDKWFRATLKLMKQLQGEPLEVANIMKERLESFMKHIPLITALHNPGLRDRHWKRLSEEIGMALRADDDFSVSRALQLDLPTHYEKIEEVSDYASKEYSLERTLDKMQGEWSDVCLDYMAWRETGTFILRGLDDIQMLLDDQIVKTQSMRASPYIGPFEERVRMWESKLNTMQEIIDEWLKCQQQWLYLEPIFGSDDIMQQMPSEGRKFRAVDVTWRRIMEKLVKNPDIMIVTSEDDLLKNLVEANKLLDIVQKGLNDYLETKRLAFPRFYFLSNDELLEILSETKDPLRVQPFLKKIFEGIHKLEFQDDLEVTAMFSEEGERVELLRSFNPKHAGGNVEKWLIDCEAIMRESVKGVLQKSFDAYATADKRTEWIISWPGQVVLCISQTYWTKEVTDSIDAGLLPEYEKTCTAQLVDIVDRVRGKLTKLDRKTIGALVVIEVHARDVVSEMVKNGVSNATDFAWMSQLRYNWEDNEMIVKMINANINYGYEYLGNSSRLVITPLTDRCYRTLMGAIHLNLGGAPEGPAGTGKTETTKDLAKAIAMQCVVFNCSDGLDYLAMAKFFKGLASSGAWACFDEFNRIELEVLSVIAQQILTIQRAKSQKLKVFEFEGTKLSLRATCNVFITMNPGYAGRSELPDNLKALFRTVAMMVPNYALISEILLYSNGYLQARDLARKLVATYRLCSEQLSSQSHYDYGMRAVISVLRAAGAVKQKYPDEDESILMLRSLKDVNKPKFLAPDIPLFEGILSDLFPGVELPSPDYDVLRAAVIENCHKERLQPTEAFLEKIFQLYEMILVRHGLMLVGLSYGAKTSSYRVLAGALTDLNAKGLLDEKKSRFIVMNPKSVYMGQLYGQFDPVSHEWQDGILAKKFRDYAVDTTPDRKWVIFDGPVDAIWIENMNTVLDDNKKLCLMSGEIIQMSAGMNMIFEVADLAAASPATVSRCGMIYVEPSQIGWRPLKVSWLAQLDDAVYASYKDKIDALFEWLVEPCLRFVRKHCKEAVMTSDIALVQSLMRMFEALMTVLFESAPEGGGETSVASSSLAEEKVHEWIDSVIQFAVVWTLGGTIDLESRTKFDVFIRELFNKQEISFDLGPGLEIKLPSFSLSLPLPTTHDVYSYTYVSASSSWQDWLSTTTITPVPIDTEFNNIIIPTIDTVRYCYILGKMLESGVHTMFVGPTGTGKTIYIKQSMNNLDDSKFNRIESTFSAQTNANMIQDIIDSKLDKRRKGTYGPPFGQKCVIFVDDLNMPAVEKYGAQPPIEILRQLVDHGGWYDRTELSFRQLVDIQFVTAMGPPGGGRNNITSRMLRHFYVMSITEFDDGTYSSIYSSILEWWAKKTNQSENVREKCDSVVSATIDVYNAIRKELLPTPAKSHYTYNMRDLSKVFQGISMYSSQLEQTRDFAKLWAHEALRTFHDRLVSDDDRLWFLQYITELVPKHIGLTADEAFGPLDDATQTETVDSHRLRSLLYGDFLNPSADVRKYVEITDQPKMLEIIREHLEDYNQQSKTPMNLVLFLYAAEHICRISRVIRQPFGNALLVGVGGSGRQSLTRIAAHMAEFDVYSIEITKSYGKVEWADDLRAVLKKAGAEGKPTVFLLSDTQIKEESFLEDVNNILNTGEVPNLFPKDDQMQIIEALTPKAKKAGKDGSTAEILAFFVELCRRNLHMVICMSPVGDSFRERLRMFPSLVNCCTIDWYSAWPDDALQSVAAQFLADVDLGETRDSVIDMCKLFHKSVRQLSANFLQDAGRHYYVTPTSYLELITTYKTLLGQKRNEVSITKNRYEVGLEKLLGAESQVGAMKEELIELQPVLVKTAAETEEMLKVIDKESKEAEAKKEVVSAEEKIANEKAQAAKAIKDDCESELAVAMPLLENALNALNTLTKNDITEVKALKNPPSGVKIVMEAVCILKGIKPKRINDPNNPVKKIDDYWPPSQALLGESTFLADLQKFDKDNIPQPIIDKIKVYVSNPDFEPEIIRKASKAAYGLCCWVRAMEAYNRVAKVVAPKQAALKESEAEYNELMVNLNQKKAALKEVEDRLANLMDNLAKMEAKKKKLEEDVDLCSKKLVRAEKLIGGLGGEKTRWTDVAARLSNDLENLVGDVLLSSGFIAYFGAFTTAYRESGIEKWMTASKEQKIPISGVFKLQSVLGDAVATRQWLIHGLPNDGFSIDNAIIMSKARRWPLMIDPQGQAKRWIVNMEKEARLEVVKLTEGDFVRKLENCIQFGVPVLLEDVGEELDPTIEPLLLKSVFKQGGNMCIRLGDSTIEYNDQFRFYITTKLRNPHYLPEVSVKVTLLNFMTTPDGLEDQLLGIVVAKERPDLEEEKTKLVLQGAENAKQLKEIEDKIIEVLSTSEGNILEDETAINVISSSKVLSNEIAQKQVIALKTEEKIDETRGGYGPVALHVAMLFFCISDLANIEPMYQYSLRWYVNLFNQAIESSEKSDNLSQRITNLKEYFTYSIYRNVCRSLFEKDKLLFSFLMSVTILKYQNKMDMAQFRFLMTGGVAVDKKQEPNPTDWLPVKNWGEMNRASDLPALASFTKDFLKNHASWKPLYDSTNPHEYAFPEPWGSKLGLFEKLIVLRLFRPDKLLLGIQNYVDKTLGRKFIEPPPFDLKSCYDDSEASTPLLFVLSPGSDPMSSLLKFADAMKVQVQSISLGQGQGSKAEKMIDNAAAGGTWVVLQNCHLATSWMTALEKRCSELTPETVSPSFRLWLTSYPSKAFPVSVLENGVKMTNEPPKGLRANIIQSFSSDPINDPEWFSSCSKPAEFQKMLFSLCFFHAFVQERTKFGPLGWNVQYQFSESDLKISMRQLIMFLDEFPDEIPFVALRYLIGECNYGGRVTDAHDRTTLNAILEGLFCADIVEKVDYKFSASGLYYPPSIVSDHAGYIDYLRSLPITAEPEAFGLHSNADISKDQQEVQMLLDAILSTGSKSGGSSGLDRDKVIEEVAKDIQSKVAQPFDLELANYKYPVEYYESMNTVLRQELVRYNRLIETIHASLVNLRKALKGVVVMNSELEAVGTAMFNGKIPAMWASKSYPSLKPLASYVNDLVERINMLQSWIDNGPPDTFWITGFFFTHAFTTGVKQNFARKHALPIDTIIFEYKCMDEPPPSPDAPSQLSKPEEGAYVYGMFVDGAKWNFETKTISEAAPKVLYYSAPMIWLNPIVDKDRKEFPHYLCPVYRTAERKGVLATTGHSTNFVMDIEMPSDMPQSHWVKRGVAMLLSLSD